MPVDFTSSDETVPTSGETPMFAPTPLWDRDVKKRRGRARSAAAPVVSDPAIDAGEAGAGAGVMGATTATEPVDSVYETQPAEPEIRRTAPVRRSGVPAGAIAAGAIAVAALAGFGWYASQPHQRGVAELTPGAPATSQIALNTAAAPPSADQLPAGAAAATSQTTTSTPARETSTPTRAVTSATTRHSTTTASRAPARVRPAESGSALDAGVNASTTAPMVTPPAPSAPTTGPTVNTPAEVMAPSTAAPAPSLSSPSAGSTTAPQTQSTTPSPAPSTDTTTTP